jgi:hypothetical protein
MGTRGLTKVIDLEGRTKVAQYGQWDHYPSGQGINMLNIISKYGMLDRIERNLKKVHWLNEDEVSSMIEGYHTNGMMNMEQSQQFESIYPALSRNTCTDILNVIAYSTGYTLGLRDDSEFEQDDLMCEGVYTINYKTRTFISQYGEAKVIFSLDSLPTNEIYLSAFAQQEELV